MRRYSLPKARHLTPLWASLVGLLLLLGLYTLPRWVVDNTATTAKAETTDELTIHRLPMSADLRMQLLHWKANWQEEKTWQWADSLAYVYLRYEHIDSALRFVSKLQEAEENEAKRKAGLYLYQAYVLSTDSSYKQQLSSKARAQLTQASALFPKDYELQVKAALTYIDSSEPMRGIRLLQALYREVPEDPDVLLALGRLSLQTAQYKKGEEKLRKLLQLHPTHTEGSLYLGRYLMQNGKEAEGYALLESARKQVQDPAMQQIFDTYLNP